MSLPLDTPTEFTVHRVEEKRTLPAKEGKPAKIILKLGLEANGQKGWAETFSDIDPATWPKEGAQETLILTQPSNPDYAPTAKRPGQGGRGGGGRGRSPAETKAIQRQHSQEMAIRVAVAAGYFKGEVVYKKLNDDLTPLIDWFEADISGGAKA